MNLLKWLTVGLLTIVTSGCGPELRSRQQAQGFDRTESSQDLAPPELSPEPEAELTPPNNDLAEVIVPETSVPFDVSQGCLAIGSCDLTNNRNQFNMHKIDLAKFEADGGCELNTNCPESMNFVCDAKLATRVCVARDLVSAQSHEGKQVPMGNFSYFSCLDHCEARGFRLLTNNEWLVAMNGTHAEFCKATAPKDRRLGSPTQDAPDFNSSDDLKNLEFNEPGFRSDRSRCVSVYGIRDGVSVLGQWVSDGFSSDRPQFNGGLWAFPSASSVFYRTTAHGPGYYDYSIGCRCGADPE